MSKRVRDHDEDDTAILDPAVQNVIEGFEGNLAQFMGSLSTLLERYNGLLQAALPHNPKAVFYYQQPEEDGTGKSDGTKASAEDKKKEKDATATSDAKAAADAAVASGDGLSVAPLVTPATANGPTSFPQVTSASTPHAGDSAHRRAPTSPLLRRPQLPPQQLEDLQLEAKAELERRTSTYAFPSHHTPSYAHTNAHTTAAATAGDTAARSPDLVKAASARTPSRDPSVVATATATAATAATSSSVGSTAEPAKAPFTPHPLGIRTTLNKVLDKKANKELLKRMIAEAEAEEGEGESDNANAAAPATAEASTTGGDEAKATAAAGEATTTTTTAADDEPTAVAADQTHDATTTAITTGIKTDNISTNNKTNSDIAVELCTRSVADVLKDVEIPPMLLAQLRILKKESQALMYTFDQIHDWIALKIPAMRESDNQGIAVMASVISVITSIMTSLQDLYDMEKEYITKRGTLECQYVPNFECSTIRDLITATDSSKWDDIEVGWRTMMRAVIIVHARLAANMKTLRAPKEKRVHHLSM